MSIETTGSAKADNFKTSKTGLAGGFVKNDAAGNFEFDQPGAGGPPVIGGSIWDLIETKSIGANTNSITFSGLNGDVDKIFKLVYRNQYASAVSQQWQLRPNGVLDATKQASLIFDQRSAGAINPSVSTFSAMTFMAEQDVVFGGTLYFSGETGSVRMMTFLNAFDSVGLAQIGTQHGTAHWTDTTANITSLEIATIAADGIEAGSLWSLYRINE